MVALKKTEAFLPEAATVVSVPGVYTANRFGGERLDVRKAADLCLPSLRVP